MSYTTSQLATAVMQHLGALDAGSTIASTDETYIADVWAAKWEEISGHGAELTYFPYSEIPNAVFLTVRDLVANEVRGAFGLPISAAEKEAEETIILRRLRRHLGAQASGLPGVADYF